MNGKRGVKKVTVGLEGELVMPKGSAIDMSKEVPGSVEVFNSPCRKEYETVPMSHNDAFEFSKIFDNVASEKAEFGWVVHSVVTMGFTSCIIFERDATR